MAREFGLHPLAVVDGLENDIDEIETEVFSGKGGVSRRIYQLSREVIQFQRLRSRSPASSMTLSATRGTRSCQCTCATCRTMP